MSPSTKKRLKSKVASKVSPVPEPGRPHRRNRTRESSRKKESFQPCGKGEGEGSMVAGRAKMLSVLFQTQRDKTLV